MQRRSEADAVSRREVPPIAPRLLTAEQAAAYLGYATTGVLANLPVKPLVMAEKGPGSQPKYDIRALDAFLDQLSGLRPPEAAPAAPADDADTAYGAWKAKRQAAATNDGASDR